MCPSLHRLFFRVGLAFVAACALVATPHPRTARAWMLFEHADIGLQAARALPPPLQAQLQTLWQSLVQHAPTKYCSFDEMMGHAPPNATCIHLGHLGALAGDHSCSPAELDRFGSTQAWPIQVIDAAESTRRQLQQARDQAERERAMRLSDVELQRLDPEYSSRAAANHGHFAVPRQTDKLLTYLAYALAKHQNPNAVALYAHFHAVAMQMAAQWHATPTGSASRATLARQMLMTESTAAHFLEDLFSAGHVVGTHEDTATMKGTHDYYCQHGLDAWTWRMQSYMAHGDGYMRAKDIARASPAVERSLAQVLSVAMHGSTELASELDVLLAAQGADIRSMYHYNACKATVLPAQAIATEMMPLLEAVLVDTIIPSRADALAPSWRAEFGPFVGVAGGARVLATGGSYASDVFDTPRARGDLQISALLGFGFGDLVGPAGDGFMYGEFGFLSGSADYQLGGGSSDGDNDTRVLSRSAYKFGLHLPFYLIPGDTLLLAPILAIADPIALQKVAITSAYGGLIPWQRPFDTFVGRMQFVLGRQLAVYLYNTGRRSAVIDVYLPGNPSPQTVGFRSVELSFPTVELALARSYGARQGLGMALQLGWGVDIPYNVNNFTTPSETPDLGPTYNVFLQLINHGRYYF
jgi:hypothetical protein